MRGQLQQLLLGAHPATALATNTTQARVADIEALMFATVQCQPSLG